MSFKKLFKSVILSSPRRRPVRRSTTARLSLEALEHRDVPSAYSITEIPMTPHDVNAHGQVVGDGGLWQDGTLTNLGSLAGPGGWSNAYAINDAGQIVGSTYNPDGSLSASAFLLTPEDTDHDGSPDRWYRDDNHDGVNDLMVALPSLNGAASVAYDINNSGVVVGMSGSQAVLWTNGQIIRLGSPASYCYATSINDAGQVVGASDNFAFLLNPKDTNGDGRPDLWYQDANNDGANDLMVRVGDWGPPYGSAAAINASGQVVGTDGDFAFLFTPSAPNGTSGNLDHFGFYSNFYPSDVGASGLVVGAYQWSSDGGDTGGSSAGSEAMLWQNGQPFNLADLLPADSGLTSLYSADAINDSGWIVGTVNGTDGYVMKPTGAGIPPMVRVSDASVVEGNSGVRPATFTITLSAAYSQPVNVAYATADGTATAGSDYQAASGTLTFAPGDTSKTLSVQVIGDRLPEPNETFFVNLSSPTNATIADGQGVGTILDDEPRISITDVTKYEGKKGQTTQFTFTVTLSAAYDQTVTMSFKTTDGTAKTSDSDYVAKTGTLTFNPGETTKTITISVIGDSKKEADETFYLDLFGLSSNALFTKNRGIGTILNDD
jgi:uncharacterized membrane protein